SLTTEGSTQDLFEPTAAVPTATGPTIMQLVVIILRQRRLITRIAIALPILLVATLLLRGRTYTSSASFLPATSELSTASVAGLAAQFGFSMPASAAGQSPDFYAELLQSEEILLRAVATD